MRLAILVAILALTLSVLVLWGISRIPAVFFDDEEEATPAPEHVLDLDFAPPPTDEMIMHFREMNRAEENEDEKEKGPVQ